MSRRHIAISLITTALLLGAVVTVWHVAHPNTPGSTATPQLIADPAASQPAPSGDTQNASLSAIPTVPFMNPTDLKTAFEIAASTTRASIPATERPVAGLVNHHNLAAPLLARFARDLHTVLPETEEIVILSPDHFNKGPGLSTHDHPYDTPSGEIEIATDDVSSLVQRGIASYSPELFKNEHGIGAVVPFLAHEFPNARILPLALRMNRPDATSNLKIALREALDRPHTFIVISADMSHYLSGDEAFQHDINTKTWIETCDEQHLWNATDQNLDSGRSVSTLCAALHADHKTPTFHLTAHDLSTNYGGDPKSTTSYLTGFWTIKK